MGRRRRRGRVDPYLQEHTDLIESIRKGEPLNELKTVAESTLTAIMGRESAYTGKVVTWDDIAQREDAAGAGEPRPLGRPADAAGADAPAAIRPRTEAFSTRERERDEFSDGRRP